MQLMPVRSKEQIDAFRESLRGRDVVVIGAGRSGMASVRRLVETGARVRLADMKTREQLGATADEAEALGATIVERFERFEQIHDADLVISSPGVPWEHAALSEARDLGVETYGTLELAWRLCASPVIAVSGTNGKGTVCRMLSGMMQAGGVEHILAGNIGLPLADMLDAAGPQRPAIVEVSSFQLETAVDFRPRVASLLNIAPDHLDRHPDFDTYARAKARIFENQQPEDIAVINHDDERARRLAEPTEARKLRVSLKCDSADAGVIDGGFFVRHGEAPERICATDRLALRGEHHLTNALVAALIARVVGVGPDPIAEAIAGYRPPKDHMEPVEGGPEGILFINDSKASNPSAAVADLSAIERPFIAIVGGKDKGADFAELGALLAARPQAVILTGEAADRIEQAIADAGAPKIEPERADTLEEAVRRACEIAESGDVVILAPACSSFDMFDNYEHRGDVFREAVRALREG